MRLRAATIALFLLGTGAATVDAQDRAALIEQARATADESVRRDLFVEAANPVAPDSLWSVAVFELARIMRDLGDDDGSAVWMRFALRHGQWDIDRAYFAPSLVTFFDQIAASAAVGDETIPEGTTTTWTWPDGFSADDAGSLEISSPDGDADVTVAVEGQGDVAGGSSLELPPGTYELTATAEGYEPASLTREVLPGAETVVSLELLPILADQVAERVGLNVLSLRYSELGALTCANALAVQDGFAVTALSALGGATQMTVSRPNASSLTAEVVGTDSGQDLAVLRIPELTASAGATSQLADSGFAWSVFRAGCDAELQAARTRLGGASALAGIPTGATGSPLVDRDGSVMGLLASGGRISSMDQVGTLIEEATAQFSEGGFPVVWVALGAAALGGAAALLLGGGDTPPTSTPGSVVVVIPGG
jgi:hypothetical protein